MVTDKHGRHHNDVGVGAASSWDRVPNRNPGCSCPPWRYNPSKAHRRPTNPDCPTHGTENDT